ncbi:hypothetical protein R1flu_012120 [Riccia fluitans]|uniref:Uncharacterized protein n=1 Tax=Riccia fluitans TaxID=41844 RepID=A0ABD1Z9P4_9MARC
MIASRVSLKQDSMRGSEMYELRLIRLLLGGLREAEDSSIVGDIGTENLCTDAVGDLDGVRSLEDEIRKVLGLIEKGQFSDALASEWMSTMLGDLPAVDYSNGAEKDAAKMFYEFVTSRMAVTLDSNAGGSASCEEAELRAILIMALGVVALCAFVQANMTGPTEQRFSSSPFEGLWVRTGRPAGYSEKEWETWARSQLMVDGCDFVGKFELPQYLILAKLLLVSPAERLVERKESRRSGPRTWMWWALRTSIMQQRVLAERSASLRSLLVYLSKETCAELGTYDAVQQLGWNLRPLEAKSIAAAVHLETGFMEHLFGHNDAARESFDTAGKLCGLGFEITGVLGFRTKYQEEPKAQMVLVTKAAPSEDDLWLDFLDGTEDKQLEADSGVEQSDIHLVPKLVGTEDSSQLENGHASDKKSLSSIEQAVILARCVDVKKNNPEDELRSWQMAPYIEAVHEQQRSTFMLKTWCQLLRIRWEKTRTRTRERAFLMMEQLADTIRKGDLKVSQRMRYAFCVPFPLSTTLLKEYAEMMVSFGLIGEALKLFEDLEMWNSLIDCYCLLGKKAAAADLIRERLKVQPEDPRLWCSLGDVIMDDECYHKAWEFSGHHFARAQRSLARTAYSKHKYTESVQHWELALALNPLHPDGWFALGSSAIKSKNLDKAVYAFTRQVQLDPENGESWNNIAAINMQRKRSKEAFVAFQQALKLKRNSWQMWENFAHVALDVANFRQALIALEKVLDLSEDKRVDSISYRRLIEELEIRKGFRERPEMALDTDSSVRENTNTDAGAEDELESFASLRLPVQKASSSVDDLPSGDIDQDSSSDRQGDNQAKDKETELLLEKTGKLLSRIVAKGQGGGEVWGLKARWHRILGDTTMWMEALLKQLRAYQGSKWQSSRENFEVFASVCLQLCEAYIGSAVQSSSKRELSAAQMLLRNTIKQAEPFTDTQQYKDLDSSLLKVQSLMEAP